MNTYEKILLDMKAAMIGREEIRKNCLRMLVSDVKNQTVNAGKELTEEVVLKCVKKAVKQHEDSVAQFESAGRADLASKERQELGYLRGYLPEALSEDELRAAIVRILETVEPVRKNMGLIMKSLPPDADKKVAAGILSQLLK